jgi:hypothetical protein
MREDLPGWCLMKICGDRDGLDRRLILKSCCRKIFQGVGLKVVLS